MIHSPCAVHDVYRVNPFDLHIIIVVAYIPFDRCVRSNDLYFYHTLCRRRFITFPSSGSIIEKKNTRSYVFPPHRERTKPLLLPANRIRNVYKFRYAQNFIRITSKYLC